MNPVLQTERLFLSISTVEDVDLFKSTWGDAEVMQTFGPGVPVLPEYIQQHLDEHIAAYQSGKMFPWSLVLKENNEKIGVTFERKTTNSIPFPSVISSEKSIGTTVTPRSLSRRRLSLVLRN